MSSPLVKPHKMSGSEEEEWTLSKHEACVPINLTMDFPAIFCLWLENKLFLTCAKITEALEPPVGHYSVQILPGKVNKTFLD